MSSLVSSPKPRGRRKEFVGTVASDRMQKTRVVSIDWFARDPQVGKYVRRRLKVKAHDERNDSRVGDRVRIRETRRLSKDKRWRVVAVLERSRRPAESFGRKRRNEASSALILTRGDDAKTSSPRTPVLTQGDDAKASSPRTPGAAS